MHSEEFWFQLHNNDLSFVTKVHVHCYVSLSNKSLFNDGNKLTYATPAGA